MPDKPAGAPAVTADDVVGLEMDVDEADVDKQLEREAEKLEEADNKVGSGSEDPDSEKSDEDHEESQGLSAREARLIARLDRLEAENANLRMTRDEDEEEEDDDNFTYDVGDVGEEFEGIRPALERNGKFLLSHVRAAEKKISKLESGLQKRFDEMEAAVIRSSLNITQEEEDAIVDFANKRGRTYANAKELRALVQDYRDSAELRELRREKKETGKLQEAKSPERTVPRKRGTSRQAAEELEEVTGDSYNSSWDRSVKKVLDDLRTGKGILGGRGL
jgi:hypothetical protein